MVSELQRKQDSSSRETACTKTPSSVGSFARTSGVSLKPPSLNSSLWYLQQSHCHKTFKVRAHVVFSGQFCPMARMTKILALFGSHRELSCSGPHAERSIKRKHCLLKTSVSVRPRGKSDRCVLLLKVVFIH